MRFLAILLLFTSWTVTCKDKATAPLRAKKAARIILPDKKTKYKRWVLAQMYDPYQKGYTYYGDTSNPAYLEIYRNGRFIRYQSDFISEGNWKLNRTKDKIALIYEIRNGVEVAEDLRDNFFRYEIANLSRDTFLLAVQGRHGMMKELWLRDTLNYLHSTDTISVDSLFQVRPSSDSSKTSNK